jgi:hypothetical protein
MEVITVFVATIRSVTIGYNSAKYTAFQIFYVYDLFINT